MKISMNWISDFAEIPQSLDDKDIAERITISACEVESFERTGAVPDEIVVASVTAVRAHPNADKLRLATVDLGSGKTATVVCGAPNCRTGIKVPYAAVGTTLPGGFTLKPKEIRGVLSEGMLCAEDELGLSDRHDGLMELGESAEAGTRLSGLLENDLILDIDNKSLTHRPDCWGHFGFARECAAVFGTKFRDPFDRGWASALKERIQADGGTAPVSVQVEKDSASRGFLGLTVQGVQVGESPDWMQRRLNAAGMRPINSIVDISNYAMLETGMPNHIFDSRTISGGKIIVRRAKEDQDFTTLDGHVRRILASDTLVCDAEKPSGIAGIMGGLDSSVTEDTTSLMIETANWTDAEVRRTSTRLGLRTDASQRYEKSLDSEQLETALLRIFELVCELNPSAKAVGGIQSANMCPASELTVDTSPSRIGAVLGEEVSEQKMTAILESLGFGVDVTVPASEDPLEKTHRIRVPSWRATKDIECEADIIEEIGRIIGYDNITPAAPVSTMKTLRLSPGKILFRKVQDFLVLRSRALEIMTYPLVGQALLEQAFWPQRNENLVLANALNPEHDRMRPSLIPSLLEASGKNAREHESFRIFECGRSYADLGGDAFSRDLFQIGIVFHESGKNPFIDLADTAETLLKYLGYPVQLVPSDSQQEHPLVPAGWTGSHPHEFLDIRVTGKSRGVVLSLHPQVSRAFKLRGRTAIAVLDATEVMEQPLRSKPGFKTPDRFPGAVFDLTVETPPETYAAAVTDVVSALKIKEIRSVAVLDVFPLGEGRQALTLRVVFRDANQTLSSDFIKDSEDRVVRALEQAGYPLRAG